MGSRLYLRWNDDRSCSLSWSKRLEWSVGQDLESLGNSFTQRLGSSCFPSTFQTKWDIGCNWTTSILTILYSPQKPSENIALRNWRQHIQNWWQFPTESPSQESAYNSTQRRESTRAMPWETVSSRLCLTGFINSLQVSFHALSWWMEWLINCLVLTAETIFSVPGIKLKPELTTASASALKTAKKLREKKKSSGD